MCFCRQYGNPLMGSPKVPATHEDSGVPPTLTNGMDCMVWDILAGYYKRRTEFPRPGNELVFPDVLARDQAFPQIAHHSLVHYSTNNGRLNKRTSPNHHFRPAPEIRSKLRTVETLYRIGCAKHSILRW